MILTCPYCEKEFRQSLDDQKPGELYEAECPHCVQPFVYEIEYEIITTSHKAACLNGGEHEWISEWLREAKSQARDEDLLRGEI